VKENIVGLTAEYIADNGSTIRFKETEYSLGQMVENMKVSTLMTKKMAMEPLSGLTEESTKDTGRTEYNME